VSKRRARTPAEKARIVAANGHRPAREVMRLVDDAAGPDLAETKADYQSKLDAADPNNRFMRRRQGLGGSGDYHIPEQQLWFVRETSRHMVDNDDLIGNALTKLADNIIQDQGFSLVVETGDPVLDAEITARHREWAGNPRLCDFYGERTWSQIQWQVQFDVDQSGDIFALPIDDGTIQLVEAERCGTYALAAGDLEWLGILRDPSGRKVGYRFMAKPLAPNAVRTIGDTRVIERYDAEGFLQVLHNYDSKRVSRSRGVPIFTPVMIKVGMLDDLQFATLVKAQSAAAHAVWFKQSDTAAGGGRPPRVGARATETVSAADGSQSTQYSDAVRYGSSVMLPKGVDAVFHTPVIPSNEHMQHVRELIRQAGGAVGCPLEIILLDASTTNYSGWRGIMDAAHMGWRRRQRDRIGQLHTPVHRLNVRRWAPTMGRVARAKMADGSIYGHRWVPAAWPYINPLEDAQAGEKLLRTGQTSPRTLLASRGQSYDDVVRDTVEDRGKALRQAITESKKIEQETGERIAPLMLLGWDVPTTAAPAGGPFPQAAGKPTEKPPAPGAKPAPQVEPEPEEVDA